MSASREEEVDLECCQGGCEEYEDPKDLTPCNNPRCNYRCCDHCARDGAMLYCHLCKGPTCQPCAYEFYQMCLCFPCSYTPPPSPRKQL